MQASAANGGAVRISNRTIFGARLRVATRYAFAACVLALALDISQTSAHAGFLDELFGGAPEYAQPAPHRIPRLQHDYERDGVYFRRAPRARRQAALTPDRHLTGSISAGEIRPHSQRRARTAIVDAVSGSDIGKFVCVRMCDGAVIALAHRDGAASQPSCDNACPGAEARLYTLRASGDDIGAAEDPVTKTSYAELAARVKSGGAPKSCACGSVVAKPDVDVDDFLADATLRNGDVVATSEGLHVFRGQRRLPHRLTEFLAFQDSRGRFSGSTDGALKAIDQRLKTSMGGDGEAPRHKN